MAAGECHLRIVGVAEIVKRFSVLPITGLLFLAAMAVAAYEREWITYRLQGCRCFETKDYCGGHPVWPQTFTLVPGLTDWLWESRWVLPPPYDSNFWRDDDAESENLPRPMH